MDLISLLTELGFEKQEDLGVKSEYAGKFFHFYGETYVFDEEGVPWTCSGRFNLSEYLDFEKDPILWETPVC